MQFSAAQTEPRRLRHEGKDDDLLDDLTRHRIENVEVSYLGIAKASFLSES